MNVIAGDIGGTKTLLALAEVEGTRVRVLSERRYTSAAFASLTDIVREFARDHAVGGLPACFGVAGPTDGRRARITNLPWVIEAEALEAEGCGRVTLLNDFAAAAYGIECVAPEHIVTLHPGTAVARAPRAVLGAGTGLGEALLYWSGDHYEVLASEGGHCDYAPRDATEFALAQWLVARHGHVSYERVVSGIGLRNLYAFLRDVQGVAESPAVAAEIAAGDFGAVVGAHALAGDDPLSVQTLDLFARAYGAQAGNMALVALARGGVFLAGGIAAKVLPILQRGGFSEAYADKGRLRDVVASIPVYVVTDGRFGLLGAAAHAGRSAAHT